MNIQFKKLTIDNFLSFGHAEIELNNRGYTLIEGINNNIKDGAKSNGSGKSTIFNALCYALTGETIQGLTSNLNNIYVNAPMKVKLEFSSNNDNYILIRSRDLNNKADLRIVVNGEDKSGKGVRESTEILNKLLPELTPDLIGEVIIIGQGMPHKFSENTPSGRKDLLEKLSHSDYMLEDIKDRIQKRADVLKNKHEEIVVEKTTKDTTKNILLNNIQKREKDLLSYAQKPDFNKEKNTLNKIINEDENCLLKLKEDIKYKELILENYNEQLITLNGDKSKQIENETTEFNLHNIDIKTNLSAKITEKNTLLEEIKKLQAIKDTCPMCHQKLPHVHKQDTSEQENKVKLLNEEIDVLKEKDDKQNEAFKLNVEDIKNSFKNKENELNENKSKIKAELSTYKNLLTQKEQNINLNKIKLNDVLREESIFDENKSKCIEDLADMKKQLDEISHEILYIISKDEEVKTHQEIIAKITTLIKRDFRGILLSNIINYIDGKCKIYAKDIFGTDELNFKLDGNNLNITYCKKPLEALSGGEQQKVDLIIQFAIRAMMQEYTGFTSNILVLDEILDNLDSVGCDSILNFITNKLSDIESIFIISHHADTLNIGNDSIITVVKNADGVSYIK